jgi:hypothetical protein
MKSLGPQFLLLLLVAIAAIALACGSSSQLRSISITPLTADAKDYSAGQVQFKAFGYYGDSLLPVEVRPEWSACPPINAVSVDKTGVAHCAAGATGTYFVQAFVPVRALGCSSSVSVPIQACGQSGPQCGGIQGVATLTCQ